MHQVYDDEMTFKLVAAASNVSGLPVEVCLEEFGKHFLVYCQKNGYDQILRVLGSNLYDFLTNLDNLHDHLASIYPGMRAPSFRVTRHINKTGSLNASTASTTTKTFTETPNNKTSDSNLQQTSEREQQQVESSLRLINNTLQQATTNMSDELHKQNASCSLAGSMYLHYYSERAGLSPIVKGLVMAVAKEFFQTDIVVTECKLNNDVPDNDSGTTSEQQKQQANKPTNDDHVILKIDRKSSVITDDTAHAISGNSESQLTPTPSPAKQAVTIETSGQLTSKTSQKQSIELFESRQQQQQQAEQQAIIPQLKVNEQEEAAEAKREAESNTITADSNQQQQTSTSKHDSGLNKPQMIQSKSMLNIYDSLSTNPRDSLVNSEIMMQTFPFNVIFDRQFNLVQVGKSLLRVTSLYWQRREAENLLEESQQATSSGFPLSPSSAAAAAAATATTLKQQEKPVKFSDLFTIVRPKIDFTFDAIADHTNQVFVVKTKPLVLNADYRRLKRLSSGSHSTLSSGSSTAAAAVSTSANNATAAASRQQQQPGKRSMSMCPMDRLAMAARCSRELERPELETPFGTTSPEMAEQPTMPNDDGRQQSSKANLISINSTQSEPKELSNNSSQQIFNDQQQQQTGHHLVNSPSRHENQIQTQNQSLSPNKQDSQQHQHIAAPFVADELADGDPGNHISLRLKGQMIILLGGELCLYLCSPRVDHLDQLMECGVKMSDFALHDRARELMLMSHTHKEDREAVKKLDQASNDLKKMDTKLRQENKRTNEVLHNIFPAKIASLLSHGHKVESESFDLVTCLYSDIIGFTKMCGSENVKPIDIVRLLNTLYLQFDNLTNIHGVFKVETIGDAYVIVGGLPEPVEDHADRCVKMGLDMVKVIATVRSPADSQPIQMRIGIHSGPVMAGIVGIRVPRYSLFGNTTTLANQLETHGVGGKIHISDFTLKNLIKRDRFVVEDNPSEISGIPFVTYFVTNYLGDETETLKHEKILEEQLIKDFELMGNKLELVDDSSHRIQIHASPSGSTTSNTLTGQQQQQQQEQQPIAAAPSISQVVAGTGTSFVSGTTCDFISNVATSASARRQSLASSSRDNSSSIDSSATIATTITAQRTTNLLASEQKLHQKAADQAIKSDVSSASLKGNEGRQSSSNNRRPLGESLVANSDEQEHFERLILMDIEDKYNNEVAKQNSYSSKGGQQFMRQLSNQLSSSIIEDAIKQVAESRSEQKLSLLLALIESQQADLELILRKKFAPTKSKVAESPTSTSTGAVSESSPSFPVSESALMQQQQQQQQHNETREPLGGKQFKRNRDSATAADSNSICERIEEREEAISGSAKVENGASAGVAASRGAKEGSNKTKYQDLEDDCCLLCDGTGSLKLIDNNSNRAGLEGRRGIKMGPTTSIYGIGSSNISDYKCSQELIRLTLPGGSLKRRTCGAKQAEREQEGEASSNSNSNSVNSHSCGDDYDWARDQASKLIYWLLSRKQASSSSSTATANINTVYDDDHDDNGLELKRKQHEGEEREVGAAEIERRQSMKYEAGKGKDGKKKEMETEVVERGFDKMSRNRNRNGNCSTNEEKVNNGISEADISIHDARSCLRSEENSAAAIASANDPTFDSSTIHYDQAFKSGLLDLKKLDKNNRVGNEVEGRKAILSPSSLVAAIDANDKRFNQEHHNLTDEIRVNYLEHKSHMSQIKPNCKGLSSFRDPNSQGTKQCHDAAAASKLGAGKLESEIEDENENDQDSSFVVSGEGGGNYRLFKPLDGKPDRKARELSDFRPAGNILLSCGNCPKTLMPADKKNKYSSYINDVKNDHHVANPSDEAQVGKANQNCSLGEAEVKANHQASLDLLQELRLEREKLEKQVDRLRNHEARVAASIVVAADTCSESIQAQPAQAASTHTNNDKVCQSSNINTTCRGQLLSSNIERMKRMDTLKRRKMKKHELEIHNDKTRGESCCSASSSNNNSGSNSFDDSLKQMQPHCFRELIPGRQVDEATDKSLLAINGKISENSATRINSEGQSQAHYHSLLELEEEDESKEEDIDDDDDIEDEGQEDKSATCKTKLNQPNLVNRNKTTQSGLQQQQQLQQQLSRMNSTNSISPKDNQRQKHINLDKEHKIAVGDNSEFCELKAVKSSFVDDDGGIECADVTPSCEQTKQRQQDGNKNNNRRTSAYSYQSLKISLNKLVNELGSQSSQTATANSGGGGGGVDDRGARKRKGFNLNYLSNMLISISPFSSPVKKRNQAMSSCDDTNEEHKSSVDHQAINEQQQQQTNRKHSSRSHSSNSRRSNNNNQQGGQQSGSRGSNCSCLKSSSSQSFDSSLNDTTK